MQLPEPVVLLIPLIEIKGAHMNHHVRSICIFISLSLLPDIAMAGDQCVELLKHGLRDYVQVKQGASQASEIRDDICTQYSQARKAAGGVRAGASYGLFSGSVSVSWDQLEQIGSMMCASQYAATAAESSLDKMTAIISPEATSAFKACMESNKRGIQYSVQFTEKFDSRATVQLEYVKADSSVARVQRIVTSDGITCDGDLWRIRDGGEIGRQGGKSMTCTRRYQERPFRDGPDLVLAKASSITIMTNVERGNIVIPFGEVGVRPPPPSSSAVLMSQFPPGVILAWYDKGIPAGWALCDGRNGTPDLRQRFLRGSESTAVGGLGGQENHDHKVTSRLKQGPLKGSDWRWGDTPWSPGPNPARGTDLTEEATSSVSSNLPPYIDVLYIMRLKHSNL